MDIDKPIDCNCWFAYFDILGFKKLLEDEIKNSNLEAFVQTYYIDILRELKRKGEYWPDHIVCTWASDSFVLFTKDDSVAHFKCLLQSAGHFFAELIQDRWPLRGAISYGRFYADIGSSIFVGPALIDAYEYAKILEMIGFVVTPTARKRLQQIQSGYTGSAGDIRDYPVRVKRVKPGGTTKRLWAYTFGRHHLTLESVKQMKKEAENKGCDENVIRKYDNTLAFLEATK